MQQALAYIEQWTKRLDSHPFFLSLRPEPDLRRAMDFARAGVFWVFTFQDIIRLNSELAREPSVKRLLDQHLIEDTGHEEWFLQDLEMIFGDAPTNVRSIFSKENFGIRAGSFALAGEVFRVSDDRLRLVLIEALESAAGYFFGRVSSCLAESGHTAKLKYFAGLHIAAEAGHEMHGEDHGAELRSIALPSNLCAEAQAMVDRMFTAFFQIADTMLAQRQATAAPA